MPEQIQQDFGWCLGRVNPVNDLFAVKTQQRFGFAVVNLQPIPNHLEIGIIQAVLLQGAVLEAVDLGDRTAFRPRWSTPLPSSPV